MVPAAGKKKKSNEVRLIITKIYKLDAIRYPEMKSMGV
jgi:hypothetical protein